MSIFKPKRAADDLVDEKELLSEIMGRAEVVHPDEPGQVSDVRDLTTRLQELQQQAIEHIQKVEQHLQEAGNAYTALQDAANTVIARKRRVLSMLNAAIAEGERVEVLDNPPKLPLRYAQESEASREPTT